MRVRESGKTKRDVEKRTAAEEQRMRVRESDLLRTDEKR